MRNNLATDEEKMINKSTNLKIISWNVNSIRARMPILELLLEKEQPDVLLLQETKCTDERFPKIPGYHRAVFGQKSYNGVAILSKKPLKDVECFDKDARCIKATLDDLCLMSVYIPCGEGGIEKYDYKRRFLLETINWVAQMREKHSKLVIGGDFNVAMTDADVEFPERFTGSVLCRPDVRGMMSNLMEIVSDNFWNEADTGEADVAQQASNGVSELFADVFADAQREQMAKKAPPILLTEKNPFTWWDYRTPYRGFRIDYIFSAGVRAEQKVLKEYRKMEIKEFREGKEEVVKPSDHAPILARVIESKSSNKSSGGFHGFGKLKDSF
jgi:exodeoxyribonuclease-3